MIWLNDIEPYVVQWGRNLIQAGRLPPGTYDPRPIQEIRPHELGYEQCHFFAGIGGWPLALQLAGWDGPAWTGSCPCQPFSVAGQRGGTADPRHLWPDWFKLIQECRPPVVFGEQVASSDGYAWLDIVQADLEGAGYAFGAVISPAAGYGAPHIRHRIYFVADFDGQQNDIKLRQSGEHGRFQGTPVETGKKAARPQDWPTSNDYATRLSAILRKADDAQICGLVDGIPARVGRLRAYGNAIVVPQAVEFVKAYMGGTEA